MSKTRYVVIGNTRKLWAIMDTLPPGMKTIEYGIPRKWIAESRCAQMEKQHMTQKYYYEATDSNNGWTWKIYHYDETGQKELIDAINGGHFTQGAALDAACEWMEEHNIDAELM